MKMIPIQVTEEGVVIPKIHLRETHNLEVIVADDYVLVRPQPSAAVEKTVGDATTKTLPSGRTRRFSFVGSGQTRNPKASLEAEEIPQREADPREGWSLDEGVR